MLGKEVVFVDLEMEETQEMVGKVYYELSVYFLNHNKPLFESPGTSQDSAIVVCHHLLFFLEKETKG